MKYLSKTELGTLVEEQGKNVAAIRKANEVMRKRFALLDGPDGRKYKTSELLTMKAEIRNDAVASVYHARKDFETNRRTIDEQADFWKTKFFGSVALRAPTSIADEMSERTWLLQKYNVMSPARFIEAMREAAAEGRAAELSVARLVFEARDFKVEDKSVLTTALLQAEKNVAYPDRAQSLELLDMASGLLEDSVSAHDSLRTDTDDVRAKAAPFAAERQKKEADAAAARAKFNV